jgi:anti-sigma regulatory factor (Ser/Thr protein kinase)
MRRRHETSFADDWAVSPLSHSNGRDVVVETLRAERAFRPVVESVRQARLFAADCATGLPYEEQGVLVLLVSELATNCIKHTASGFSVAIEVDRDRARVRVTDCGFGTPVLGDPHLHDCSGRGLLIVQQLSDDWGVDTDGSGEGKTVWFSMSLT